MFCLGKISKDFTIDNKIKTGLNECVNKFSVDNNNIQVDNILDIHKYLMKKKCKIMCGFIEKMFVGLLSFGASFASVRMKPL